MGGLGGALGDPGVDLGSSAVAWANLLDQFWSPWASLRSLWLPWGLLGGAWGNLGELGELLGLFWGAPGVPGRTLWDHFGVIVS